MADTKTQFDAPGFFAALDGEREARGMTWKQVAEKAKVSASTLTRLSQGKRPDVDSLSALMAWSHLDARQFVGGQTGAKPSSLGQVVAQFRADPHLSAESAAALEEVVKATYKRLRKD